MWQTGKETEHQAGHPQHNVVQRHWKACIVWRWIGLKTHIRSLCRSVSNCIYCWNISFMIVYIFISETSAKLSYLAIQKLQNTYELVASLLTFCCLPVLHTLAKLKEDHSYKSAALPTLHSRRDQVTHTTEFDSDINYFNRFGCRVCSKQLNLKQLIANVYHTWNLPRCIWCVWGLRQHRCKRK